MQVTKTEWDERNGVEVRHIDDAGAIEHSAGEDLSYVIPFRKDGGLPVRCLYTPGDSQTLVVAFHGSLQRTKYQLPRFEWRKTLGELDAGRLFFADTTLELDGGMPLGWYIGTAAQDLADDVAAVIRQVAADGNYSRVLLAGSSGGGFAAMAVARRIPGSVAVSFSPQTRVGDYIPWVHKAFVKAAFPGHETIDDVEAQYAERVNLRRLYAEPEVPNYVRYVQNSNDTGHVTDHYAPFAASRFVDASTGGVDASGRIRLVLEAMQQGHQPPSRGRFLGHIRAAHEEFFGEPLGG
ncbi:alpha/beta fold hydrolase [Arthrobacter mobilis]|uniref:Alpha/beta hydrolase n=1 Tax=Arthrobacter mobilis TaxID=2724944 RepID=A0A7X6K6Q5_9MICC|nr:alpha/beta hydrolase [Arthrobacter mobilis]NKX55358.1 alpha/beta hydrolase [Arthrobacter mobilis]